MPESCAMRYEASAIPDVKAMPAVHSDGIIDKVTRAAYHSSAQWIIVFDAIAQVLQPFGGDGTKSFDNLMTVTCGGTS